jgi:hypothetical protein
MQLKSASGERSKMRKEQGEKGIRMRNSIMRIEHDEKGAG